MKIPRFYYSLPIPFQNILINMYGLLLFYKRYNVDQRNACELLRRNECRPYADLQQAQLEYLQKMLVHCGEHVPYYKALFKRIAFDSCAMKSKEDLSKIPLLEKKDIIENPESFIAKNIKKSDMIVEETSGTTGSPLKVYWHKKFYPWIYALSEVRIRNAAGVNFRDKRANLTGKVLISARQKKPPFWRYNWAEKQLYMSSYHLHKDNIPFYIETLKKIKPKYIFAYPGSILPIAQYMITTRCDVPSVQCIFSSSEYLSPKTRDVIEKAFKCKVYNNYGSVEWTSSVNECAYGRLHISPEFGIIEILDKHGNAVPRGQVGEMVCTGLLNYAMPFIRYKTGDLASFPEKDEPCPCGRTFPVLKSLEGRKMSFISLPGGGTVSSAALSTAFHAQHILESQIFQDSLNEVLVKLVVTEQFSHVEKNYLMSELEKRLKPLSVRFEYVDMIPRKIGGKHQWIVNRLQQSHQTVKN